MRSVISGIFFINITIFMIACQDTTRSSKSKKRLWTKVEEFEGIGETTSKGIYLHGSSTNVIIDRRFIPGTDSTDVMQSYFIDDKGEFAGYPVLDKDNDPDVVYKLKPGRYRLYIKCIDSFTARIYEQY
jgi:hypothetical protein